jgi:hypothetical protein
VKLKQNGDGSMDAKIGLVDILKLVTPIVAGVTLVLLGLSYLGIGPADSRAVEARMVRTEATLELLTETVTNYITSNQVAIAALVSSAGESETRLTIIEATRFTVQDGIELRRMLEDLKAERDDTRIWRNRVTEIRSFLASKFPEEFKDR